GDLDLKVAEHAIYFADGIDPRRDLQFEDPKFEVPRVNELMARISGQTDDLFLQYRSSKVPGVWGPANRKSLTDYFSKVAPKLREGDRLFIYFTGHGGKGSPARNTTMALWGESDMPVREFMALLDKVSPKVEVVLVMVQCHSGGFADVIFEKAEAGPMLNSGRRCGFFATVPERTAA